MITQITNINEAKVQQVISQIIERSRHHEEMFLIDSKTAATNILKYLQKENLILPVLTE